VLARDDSCCCRLGFGDVIGHPVDAETEYPARGKMVACQLEKFRREESIHLEGFRFRQVDQDGVVTVDV
jgi:hypothetical protein